MTPSRWLEIAVRAPPTELSDELVEGLLALGGTAVEEDGELLRTYVPEPPRPERFLERATARLGAIAGAELRVEWRWRADEDWSRTWREGLTPRRVGEQMIVAPSWTDPEPESGDVVIRIEPGMAFGTGEHATTRGALVLLERTLRPGDTVLDVGAGSGILSIAAVLLGADRVLAVDRDGDALENARGNMERNAVDGVDLVEAAVDAAWLAPHAGAWDVVVANVLSGVLRPLVPGLAAALRRGGRLILSGILDTESAALTALAEAAGLRRTDALCEDAWWSGLFVHAASDPNR